MKHYDQNAILLPTVVDYLETNFNDIVVSNGISPLQNTHDIKNSNWLLSELSALLQHHMAYRCSVKRYGTVLYRYGGDLLHALNVSLGKLRAYVHKEVELDNSHFETKLTEVCNNLTAKCHAATQQMIENQGNPDEIETLDFEKLIKNLDPDLWKAMCLITKPVSLKAQSNLYGSHIRKMRRLFCAYTLLFTTNSHCSFSIYSLLADIV